jgi:hypothetical protein
VGACAAAVIASTAPLACGDSPATVEPRPTTPGLHLYAGATGSDTIGATISTPLKVQVNDSAGRPAANRRVNYMGLPGPVSNRYGTPDVNAVTVSPDGSPGFYRIVGDTTDANGTVVVRIRLGLTAGSVRVAIAVPDFGYADTATYTVLPGGAAGAVVGPADTVAYVGHSYTLRGSAVDRGLNVRASDPVTYSIVSGPATVNQTTGAVMATGIGRVMLQAKSGTFTATASVSVVPVVEVSASQTFAASIPAVYETVRVQLDGSSRQPLAPWTADRSLPPAAWSPDGQSFAMTSGDSLFTASAGGAQHLVIAMNGPLTLGAGFSPDGSWIYFGCACTGTAGPGLYRVRPDGSELTHLGAAGANYVPSPSPDGVSLAYLNTAECGVDDCVRVLDLATQTDRTFGGSNDLARATVAAWSPTSDVIAYALNATGLALIRSDGTGEVQLDASLHYVEWISWSPDGNWLIVSNADLPQLIDVRSGARLPLPTLIGYKSVVWRP